MPMQLQCIPIVKRSPPGGLHMTRCKARVNMVTDTLLLMVHRLPFKLCSAAIIYRGNHPAVLNDEPVYPCTSTCPYAAQTWQGCPTLSLLPASPQELDHKCVY